MTTSVHASALVILSSAFLPGVPVFAQEAVQWPVSEGGNGHWYRLVETDLVDGNLEQLQGEVVALGANLVSISDQAEQDFVTGLSAGLPGWTALGAKIMTSFPCDETSWEWFDNPEPMTRLEFTAWDVEGGQPDCSGGEYIGTWGVDVESPLVNAGLWHDIPGDQIRYAVIEWSADCNDDGIVDYGQILDGTLVDLDDDIIPDCCKAKDCPSPADFNLDGCVDGTDLSIVLGYWGVSDPGRGDINGDGEVNGSDLSILLGAWSPCP